MITSILTCYYIVIDILCLTFRPERIKCGEDIVLHPGFALSEDGQAKPSLQRQRSVLSKVYTLTHT